MSDYWSTLRHEVVRRLFDTGAIKLNFDKGFVWDVHSRGYPDAPRSSYFISIRTAENEGAKQGNLSADDVTMLGRALVALCYEHGVRFDYVVGIPNAGVPLARAFASAHPSRPLTLHLDKTGEGEGRVITLRQNQEFKIGASVVIADDVCSGATTKGQSVKPLRQARLKTTDIIVLIDHCCGGGEALARMGIKLHSVLTVTELFDIALKEGLIDPTQYERIKPYPALLKEYIRSQDEARRKDEAEMRT